VVLLASDDGAYYAGRLPGDRRGLDRAVSAGPLLIEIDDHRPEVHSSAWLAPTVVLSGRVRVGADANLWFGVVARGDEEPIEIGEAVNVQDNVVLHPDPGLPLTLASYVAIGHGAIVYGATVATDALIGMGAVVLSGAVVGAGAVVKEDQEVPAGQLAVGVPARIVGPTAPGSGRPTCAGYIARARAYPQSG
jgi:carbonic anhydrase/acetyltransferase-like protein (isoleucine patch superfamily)